MADRSLPIYLQDTTALAEVDPATWRAVLDAAGEKDRLKGETVTWERLRASLADADRTEAFSDVLETIHGLGTEQGRELVIDAAGDLQISLPELSDLPAREFVARMWVRGHQEPNLHAILRRAKVHASEIKRKRQYREFAAKDGQVLPEFNKEKMRSALATWFETNREANAVNVFPYERDGEWYCEIIKGEPLKRVMEVKNKNLSLLEFRPASSDVIRYDPKTRRIGIATRSQHLLQTYRSLLGTLVANEKEFFTNENICSLSELQRRGRTIFDRHFPGIVRVDVVELRWRRGDRDKIWVHGRDCFKLLDDLGARLTEGELIEAKLTISFAGGGRQGHVSLKTPNRIDINASMNSERVERMLDQVGIRGVFGDDDVGRDFFSRYPWKMREASFRRLLPTDFDRLLRENTIRKVMLETTTHPDHPAAKDALTVVNLDAQTMVGISDDPAVPSRTLTTSDVEGYELDFEKLAKDVASALKLAGACAEIDSGLWSLGRRVMSTTSTIAVFLAARTIQSSTSAVVQVAASGAKAILLFPKCCSCSTSLPSVPCTFPAGPHNDILEEIVRQLNLENEVEPHVYMNGDFIVDHVRGQVWLRGVPITELKPGTHPFKLLDLLARSPGQIVSKRSIGDVLSTREDDEVVKQAKTDLLKFIRNGLSAAGLTSHLPSVSNLVKTKKNEGYILQASARIVAKT